jgi:DNA recombination protein RmuC
MEFAVLALIILAGLFGIYLLLSKKITSLSEKQSPSVELLEYLKTTNQRLDEQSKQFTNTLSSSTRDLNQRLDNAAKVIGDVQKNIGEMSEIGRGMRELQEFLKNPKLRGNIGEHVLNELLAQMLPKQSFHLQYSFKTGDKVDAAIKTSAGIIPIDSKFPMENFRKMHGTGTDLEKKRIGRDFENDVKKHIDAIAKKYILTDEGTIDYALMYVPSEAVYYEIVNNAKIFDYASGKRVLPVSPTTFYAYLKAILMSFEGQKIEAQAKKIFVTLRAAQKDYLRVEENLNVLQRHLNNAHNMMSTVFGSFTLLGQKISSTQSLGEEVKSEAKKLAPDKNP